MATLKEPIKIFIVQALACRDTPQEVADAVQQEFGVMVNRMQCASYDPTKISGRNLSKKFQILFKETRSKFDKGLIDIPIANKYFRMRQYDKLLKNATNTMLSLRIMEQAAKDSGDQFTNRKEITGAGGGPVKTEMADTTAAKPLFSPEQLASLSAQELSRLCIQGDLK